MAQQHIAVLGAGKIGGTLGRKWVAAGHQVTFGANNPNGEKEQALKQQLGDAADIRVIAEAIQDADVVVFAIPGSAMAATVANHAAALNGKIVIDATNNMGGGGPTDSYAVFQQYTPQARYARAFNTLGWENFADPMFGDTQADLFYAGGEADRATLDALINDIGLRPVWLGGSDQVEQVDALMRLWFALAVGQQKGRHLAFKMLTR